MLRISPDFTGTAFDFDPSSIPQCQVNTMMDTLLQEARAYFEIPGIREKYEAWKKEQEQKGRRL